jgi:hypothetical protein
MMSLSLSLKQSQLQLSGGACRSVFPRVDAWLLEDSDHVKIARDLEEEVSFEYRSIVDLLFFRTFRDQQELCVAFYEGRGKPLRELYSARELAMFERGLFWACETAYERFKADRLRSWAAIAGMVALRVDSEPDKDLEKAIRENIEEEEVEAKEWEARLWKSSSLDRDLYIAELALDHERKRAQLLSLEVECNRLRAQLRVRKGVWGQNDV